MRTQGIRALAEGVEMSPILTSSEREPASTVTPLRRPSFLIIGAAKSGTTTLRTYLSRHPQLFVPHTFEPEFFGDKYDLGWDWYASLFAEATDDQLCGESSPIYTWWDEYPKCPARIAEHLPDVKLIYILRHPVERTYSQYLEQIRARDSLQIESPALESFEAFVNYYGFWVQAGEYMRFIDEYLKYFPRERLLILFLEDLKRDTAGLLAQTLRFIGVDEQVDLTQSGSVHGKSSDNWIQWSARKRLTAPLRRIPGIRPLLGTLIPPSIRERLYQMLERSSLGKSALRASKPPAMQPETRARLIERFREPNRRLSEFLGRDLEHWNR